MTTFREIANQQWEEALRRGDVAEAEKKLLPRRCEKNSHPTAFRWENHPGVVGDVEGDARRDEAERAASPAANPPPKP